MKRSKLTIKFCKIFIDLQKFVVIKVLFKEISGKFISKLLLTVKYDMINSCKIFSIRYKMKGTKHPWLHEQEIKVLENLRCTTCIQIFVNLSRIFFGCVPLEVFLNDSGTPWWFCIKLCPSEQNFFGNISGVTFHSLLVTRSKNTRYS